MRSMSTLFDSLARVAICLAFAVWPVACGDDDDHNGGISPTGTGWCCTEMDDMCMCLPEEGSGCPGRGSTCTQTYPCCGFVDHAVEDDYCACTTDAFLASLNATCDEWFAMGDGPGRTSVASCPSK